MYRVVNGDPRHSDHRPVIIEKAGAAAARREKSHTNNPRFEARWLEEEGYRDLVQNAWEKETVIDGKKVVGAVRGVMKELIDWSKNIMGDMEKRIHRVKKELEEERRKNISPDQVRREHMLRFKLSRLEGQLETY